MKTEVTQLIIKKRILQAETKGIQDLIRLAGEKSSTDISASDKISTMQTNVICTMQNLSNKIKNKI